MRPAEESRELTINWAWWMHPVVVALLLVGGTAALSMLVSEVAYATNWGVPKFLAGDAIWNFWFGFLALLLGLILTAGRKRRGGKFSHVFSARHVQFLRSAYRITFVLTLLGYVLWFGVAASQGVGAQDLISVLDRQDGAISDLKARSRPVGGLTTATQFGPVAVVLGYLLRRMNAGGRSYLWLLAAATVRTIFYAERLALLEVLIPLVLVASLTVSSNTKRARLTRVAPLIMGPLLWMVFAVSEYSRSWVYYEGLVNASFPEWVSTRLLGYYATSYNNSALLDEVLNPQSSTYFSLNIIWNIPGLSSALGAPLINGAEPGLWWAYTLATRANPEFNNTGSFLSTHAEFGLVGSLFFWFVVGLGLGGVYASLTRGSLPALLALPTLYIGILELPRFIYWTQGRSFPILMTLLVITLLYPRGHADPANRVTSRII